MNRMQVRDEQERRREEVSASADKLRSAEEEASSLRGQMRLAASNTARCGTVLGTGRTARSCVVLVYNRMRHRQRDGRGDVVCSRSSQRMRKALERQPQLTGHRPRTCMHLVWLRDTNAGSKRSRRRCSR
jgi:hypothetical protein